MTIENLNKMLVEEGYLEIEPEVTAEMLITEMEVKN